MVAFWVYFTAKISLQKTQTDHNFRLHPIYRTMLGRERTVMEINQANYDRMLKQMAHK